jgi:uncharacterized protein YggT (Ycf19 family)
MDSSKIAADEARRIAQHERIKGKLEDDVHAQVADVARAATPTEQARIHSLASELKGKATAEVLDSESELDRARRLTRVSQVVDYVFYLIYGLIGLEVLLELLGARQSSGFKRFLDLITTPILGPFRGLMPDPSVGSLQLMLSYLAGLLVYFLLHRAVLGLLRLFVVRKSAI